MFVSMPEPVYWRRSEGFKGAFWGSGEAGGCCFGTPDEGPASGITIRAERGQVDNAYSLPTAASYEGGCAYESLAVVDI